MDKVDRKILDILQTGFPLCVNPWSSIGIKLGISEDDVLQRIKILKKDGVIRQISPIFDSSKIGYHSTLCAFKVPDNRIESVAEALVGHSGISHCYLRDNSYNIWFTLTLEKRFDLNEELSSLAQINDIDSWLDLPALKVFKISFTLDMNGCKKNAVSGKIDRCRNTSKNDLPVEKEFIRAVQHDLPLKRNPFEDVAIKLECSQQYVVDNLKSYINTGQIRRFAAILRPLRAGYSVNLLVAWKPSVSNIETLGKYAASLANVSHCYQRKVQLKWPYSVYTMIHEENESTCRNIIGDIEKTAKVSEFCVLKTLKEFKKVRVIYYP
ncbi:MAG TPA: AsnC family transcriptional regulator [Chitinispirillaceae bacterium]|nr:AsnC family transcriptional regulator [Chitinispirillaceae bacterium]